MAEFLLEDEDGAPLPEAVQAAFREALAEAWDKGRAAERRDWEFTADLVTPDEDRQPWPNPYRGDSASDSRIHRPDLADSMKDAGCGGCRDIGSHRRHCPRHPDYHPWKRLADVAEDIGDRVGEPGLANRAWALAGAIREAIPGHPYRRGDA